MSLGKRLRQLREERDLYMTDLAPIIGVGKSTISGYENDKKRPKMATLKKLADFYGVTVDYLLDREEETELPAYIMKIAKDINNLPEHRKDEFVATVRSLLKMVEGAEDDSKNRKD